MRQRLEIRFRDAVERRGHQGVAAGAAVLAVREHDLGEELLALAGEARWSGDNGIKAGRTPFPAGRAT